MNIRALVGENLAMKVLSVVLAFGAWLVAQGEQVHQVTVEVPVQYKEPVANDGDPSAMRLVMINDTPLPETVSLQVSGTRVAINKFVSETDTLRYTVDWSDATSGLHVHSFRRIPGGGATNLAIEAVSPAEIEVTFDGVDRVTLPVRLRRAGALAPGLREGTSRVNPERVTLVGSRRELSRLEYVETAPLRLNELNETGYLDELALELGGLHLLPESPREVSVVVEVEKDVDGERRIKGLPIRTSTQMAGFELVPVRYAARLRGPPEVLREIGEADLKGEFGGNSARLDIVTGERATVSVLTGGVGDPDRPAVRVTLNHPRSSEVRIDVEPAEFRVTKLGTD